MTAQGRAVAFPKPKKKGKRKKRPRLPKISALETQLWRAFSLWIRLRDNGNCCMGKLSQSRCQGPLQAGHLISRRFRATRYDERNVFAQCAFHNKLHSYNPHPMTLWYVGKFGEEQYASVVVAASRITKRPTRADYEALITRYGSPPVSPPPWSSN